MYRCVLLIFHNFTKVMAKLKFYSLIIDLDIDLLPGQRLSLDNRVVDAGWKGVLAKLYSEKQQFRPSDISLRSTGLLT